MKINKRIADLGNSKGNFFSVAVYDCYAIFV